ncbi:MAG TPA: (d)CMP kinase [Cyclobacteriaceae bacterium]|nr:(d)CMP kinase [Cyclobacteriaceae bacterium]
MRRITIAIDGYSACGKSTTARRVAAILGYRYIDSGAMYRAVTLYFLENHISLTNPKEVKRALDSIRIAFQFNPKGGSETFLNGLNVENAIREMRVSENVSPVATLKDVRAAMVEQQRRLGKHKAVVMDGRDIGTVVFPDAELKLFLTADIHIRAYRRQKEFLEKGELIGLESIVENIQKRDKIDSTRAESPLVKAAGAIEVDTSFVTIDEQVDEVIQMALGSIFSTLPGTFNC